MESKIHYFKENKIHFPNENKLKNPKPLTIVKKIVNFHNSNQEDFEKKNKLDRIDEYYLLKDEIEKSKVGSLGNKKYNAKAIANIHEYIFDKKQTTSTKKNDQIDDILNYYRTVYTPRVGVIANNTYVDISSGLNSNNNTTDIILPFIKDNEIQQHINNENISSLYDIEEENEEEESEY